MTRIPAEERDVQILQFISDFIKHRHIIPTYDEIVTGTGIKAKSHVLKNLRRMEQNGWIARLKGCSRSIQILPGGERILQSREKKPAVPRRHAGHINQAAMINVERLRRLISLPIHGRTFAGELTLMASAGDSLNDPEDTLTLYEDMLPPKTSISELFVLEVRGDSMIEAGIHDGDYIVVQKANTANNGEMAVIWFDDTHETTLKYFFKEKETFRLQPANASMAPIIVGKERKLSILGKVVRVVTP